MSNTSNTKTPSKDFNNITQDLLRDQPIYEHIHKIWPKLTFDHEDLLLGGADNPLIYHKDDNPFFVYISDKESIDDIQSFYQSVRAGILEKVNNQTLPADKLEKFKQNGILDIKVRHIPRGENGELAIPYDEHGLLHIPKRAISPGLERFPKGIVFNWDTAFMIRALVQDGMVDLAKDLTDVMLYEIEHYGGILNANATFCLTDTPNGPRCQPPFIASKVMMIYNLWDQLDYEQSETREQWLERALPLLENHIDFWTNPDGCHYNEELGLSKYGSTFGKPAVEALHAEPAHFSKAYQDLLYLWTKHNENPLPVENRNYQGRKDAYYVEMFLDLDENDQPVPFSIDLVTQNVGGKEIEVYNVQGLKPAYFNGDIAMRESGLDATRRFGFMAADADNLCQYDLNCLVKKMQSDLSELYKSMAKAFPHESKWQLKQDEWHISAEDLAERIRTTMWDKAAPQFEGDNPEDPDNPMPPSFRDIYISPLAEKYNLGDFRRFNYAGVATALFCGVADEDQAHILITENLPLFMDPKGISLSTHEGDYMWGIRRTFSPEEIKWAEGAELAGYYHVAKHLRTVRYHAIADEFNRTGTIWEKMETITGTCNTAQYQPEGVGYDHNDPGFGWTNAEWIGAALAIPRLELKIAGDYIPPPCISTNFIVKDEGVASTAKDSPDMLTDLLDKAQTRLKRQMPNWTPMPNMLCDI